MKFSYEYDVFISFSHEDGEKVRDIYNRLTGYGLRVFWSEEKLKLGKDFTGDLKKALINSQHFILYCSKNATKSDWVRTEWKTFLDSCHNEDKENRLMYVLKAEDCKLEDIPDLLKEINRPRSIEHLLTSLVSTNRKNLEKELELVSKELVQEREKVEEAQNLYRHNRFWRPNLENRDVHIFTCARDVPQAPGSTRGEGGRTNIDKWDYRAVLDITHFFASNYPNRKVIIADPRSKLGDHELKDAGSLADQIDKMRSMLEGKDCIIIGSPDVSDFAEIVLARIHGIAPYKKDRVKGKGFVIIKEKQYTRSSFYWAKGDKEKEGVAQILAPNKYDYFPHNPAVKGGEPGETYGILTVAKNPFCKKDQRGKIVILSGFSGVATNAIAKILTDNSCLTEFYKLDRAYKNIDRNIEALIGVKYVIDSDVSKRDTRQIANSEKSITFEKLVEI